MMTKSAQAAMEFLMTYGWVLVVVLILIGALAYFGAFNGDLLLPEKCDLQSGLTCSDSRVVLTNSVGTSYVRILVQNNMGYNIIISKVNVTSPTSPAYSCINLTSPQILIANGATQSIKIDTGCQDFPKGVAGASKKKFNVDITYYLQGSIQANNHTITGELFTKVFPS